MTFPMTDSNDSKTEEQEEQTFLRIFQEKQRDFYLENEKQSSHKKWLTHLKRRHYPLPKDLLNLVLSFIPEYTFTWFTNGEFNLSINSISLHNEFLENRGKVIHEHNSFIHHGVCECGVCNQYNNFILTEYEKFYFIANSMGVQIVSLCPSESYDDYNQFKSDNPDIKQRIIDYIYDDWHRDSLLNLHISWMKRVCENRIEFCYELLPEFYQWANRKRYGITYDCMETFIKKLLKVDIKPNATDLDHANVIKLLCDKCTRVSFEKKAPIVAKAYRYMACAIDYVRRQPILLETSIRKAHEFKNETHSIRLHLAIDNYLNLLG